MRCAGRSLTTCALWLLLATLAAANPQLQYILLGSTNGGDFDPNTGASNRATIALTIGNPSSSPMELFVTVSGWTSGTHYDPIAPCALATVNGTAGMKITIPSNHASGEVCSLQAKAAVADGSTTLTVRADKGAFNPNWDFAGAPYVQGSNIKFTKPIVTGLEFVTPSPFVGNPSQAYVGPIQYKITLNKEFGFSVPVVLEDVQHMGCRHNSDQEDIAYIAGAGCRTVPGGHYRHTISGIPKGNKEYTVSFNYRISGQNTRQVSNLQLRVAQGAITYPSSTQSGQTVSYVENTGITVQFTSTISMTVKDPSVSAVTFVGPNPLSMGYSDKSSSVKIDTPDGGSHTFPIVVKLCGALSSDITGFPADVGACSTPNDITTCCKTETITRTSGQTSVQYPINFKFAGGTARTLTATVLVSSNTNLSVNTSGNAHIASLTTVFPPKPTITALTASTNPLVLDGATVKETTLTMTLQQAVPETKGIGMHITAAAGTVSFTGNCVVSGNGGNVAAGGVVTMTFAPNDGTSKTCKIRMSDDGSGHAKVTLTTRIEDNANGNGNQKTLEVIADRPATSQTFDTPSTNYQVNTDSALTGYKIKGPNSGSKVAVKIKANVVLKGSATELENADLEIDQGKDLTIEAGVQLKGNIKFKGTGRVVLKTGFGQIDASKVTFENCAAVLESGVTLKQTSGSRRLLSTCTANPIFSAASVTLAQGSTLEGCNIGTISAASVFKASMIMTPGAPADRAFFEVVAGGTGIVSVVSSTFVDQDPTNIHTFLDNLDAAGSRHLTDVRLELSDYEWNGNTLATVAKSNAVFGISFKASSVAANTVRLIIKDNTLNLGQYLAPYSDVNIAPTTAAVFAIAADTQYQVWNIRNQTLVEGCLDYIPASPDMRIQSGSPRCSLPNAFLVTGTSNEVTAFNTQAKTAAGQQPTGCANSNAGARALTMLNPNLRGNLVDAKVGTEVCSALCSSECHQPELETSVDGSTSFTQVVDASSEWDSVLGELRINVYVNNPQGSDDRIRLIALNPWADTTAYSFGFCDSLYGSNAVPATPAGGNSAQFATANQTNLAAGQWVGSFPASRTIFGKQYSNLVKYSGTLSIDQIAGCSQHETDAVYEGTTSNSLVRKLAFPMWVYAMESSYNGTGYTTPSGARTVQAWTYNLTVSLYSDGYASSTVSTLAVESTPIPEGTEVLTLLDNSYEYRLRVYTATKKVNGETISLRQPFYSNDHGNVTTTCSGTMVPPACKYNLAITTTASQMECLASHPWGSQYNSDWCVQMWELQTSGSGAARIMDFTMTLSFFVKIGSQPTITTSTDNVVMQFQIYDARTLIDETGLFSVSDIIPHLRLNISKASLWKQQPCHKSDSCTFIQREAAMSEVYFNPTDAYSAQSGKPTPGSINIDLLNARACMPTQNGVTAEQLFNGPTSSCALNDVSLGSCGCNAATSAQKRVVDLTGVQCAVDRYEPTCHTFQCVSGRCDGGPNSQALCTSNAVCNADRNGTKPGTCMSGVTHGAACTQASECANSKAITSCQAPASLGSVRQFETDLKVKQYDPAYSYSYCLIGGMTPHNPPLPCWKGVGTDGSLSSIAACPSGSTCNLIVDQTTMPGTNITGHVSDFSSSYASPTGRHCLANSAFTGHSSANNGVIPCRLAADGGNWHASTVKNATEVCFGSTPTEREEHCMLSGNRLLVGFDTNKPLLPPVANSGVFFDYRVRVSLALKPLANVREGHSAISSALTFDLSSASTVVEGAVSQVITVKHGDTQLTMVTTPRTVDDHDSTTTAVAIAVPLGVIFLAIVVAAIWGAMGSSGFAAMAARRERQRLSAGTEGLESLLSVDEKSA